MRSPVFAASLVTALLAVTGARGSGLVLTDGQVIKGSNVRREGDSYLITIAGGNTVAFPTALVKEVSLEDDPRPAAPPAPAGFDTSGPKTLAGPPPGQMHSQDPKDQLAVFGPPTKWSKDVVDTTWVPTNAYDRSSCPKYTLSSRK